MVDRKSTRLNSSHTEIYTLSLHDALPIFTRYVLLSPLRRPLHLAGLFYRLVDGADHVEGLLHGRSEEHTSELQSHRDLHSFPTRRSSDLYALRVTLSPTPPPASRGPFLPPGRWCRPCRRPATW